MVLPLPGSDGSITVADDGYEEFRLAALTCLRVLFISEPKVDAATKPSAVVQMLHLLRDAGANLKLPGSASLRNVRGCSHD